MEVTRTGIIGAALDAVTLSTVAVLATIALIGATNPTMVAGVVPLMVGTFAVTLVSGTAKIILNHRTATH